ncbi:MAG: hypothetical protein JW940_34685 [Polyangiaceae bacterium]|nr:hypothetical protein [Polyangiaceae bacterium]
MKNMLALTLLFCSSALLVVTQSVDAKRSHTAPSPTAPSSRDREEHPQSRAVEQASVPDRAPVDPAPSRPTELLITRASKQHDFRVLMNGGCTKLFAGSDICEGPAVLSVLRKGSATEIQRLTFPNVSIVRSESNEVLVNTAELHEYQGSLVLDDFNFDGHQDLAVQVGQDGPYGGPSFEVLLYRAHRGRYELSEPLSALTRENLGLFEVIPARKRIATFAKSGCCYHVTQQYEFVGTKPVMVARHIEDALGTEGFLVETTEDLVKGRWVRTVHREPLPDWGHDW